MLLQKILDFYIHLEVDLSSVCLLDSYVSV